MLTRSTLWSSTIALSYIAIAAIASQLVVDVVPQPYLDEIFHIPQAQQYCKGEFAKYDPKLTTPPGLYIISLLQGQIGSLFTFRSENKNLKTCQTVSQLRQTSLFALFLLPYILASYCLAIPAKENKIQDKNVNVKWQRTSVPISPLEAITRADANPTLAAQTARSNVSVKEAEIYAKRRKGWWGIPTRMLDDIVLTLNVHTIAFLPPMWFFGLLYYTDVPSTLFVMGMLAASKRNENFLAALLGAISLTLRQTNVVWMLFAMGTSALDNLSAVGLDTRPLCKTTVWDQVKSISSVPVLTAIRITFFTALPYIPVFGASAAFILYNGSIVLGDKEHHQVSTHWVQPFYFAAFATFFAWPTLLVSINKARKAYRFSLLKIFTEIAILVVIFSIAFLAVHYGTVEHPFILADNRHYAFYFWRKIIKRTEWARYALIVPYTISIRAWWITLSQHFSIFWLLGLCACLSAAVIPSPLIEPRYFMIPFIIARLGLMEKTNAFEPTVGGTRQDTEMLTNISKPFFKACIVESIWFALINGATLYLFLYKPFHWPDSLDWQRFMW
jgi:alpha-1,2-glucosyltransferase